MLSLTLLIIILERGVSSVPRGHETILTMLSHISGDLAKANIKKMAFNPDLQSEGSFDPKNPLRVPPRTASWYSSMKELDVLKPTRRAPRGGLRGRKLWGNSGTEYTYDNSEIQLDSYSIASQYGVFDMDSDARSASGSGDSGDWLGEHDDDGFAYDDDSCYMEGFAFIGSSYSILDTNGNVGCPSDSEDSGYYSNPFTHPINNNQFRMQCIIDRQFKYLLSADSDGWLVGGGYPAFNNAGFMMNKDSSHTELLRIGATCGDKGCGGITREYIYAKMAEISQPVLHSYPKYVKAGNDAELKMQIVDEYDDNNGGSSYSSYEQWGEAILDAFSGFPCVDDGLTNEHISMLRGAYFKSGADKYEYLYVANLEVAKWQAVYGGQGVAIGTTESICLQEDDILGEDETNYLRCQEEYGYGNVQYFHGRNEMTRTFWADQSMMSDEDYELSTYFTTNGAFPELDDDGSFDFSEYASGSGDNNYDDDGYSSDEYNQYTYQNWDFQEGFVPPQNCEASGRTFLGIPLMNYFPTSAAPLFNGGSYESFLSPETFNWKIFCDSQQQWVAKGGSNHMCLTGVEIDETYNAGGYIEQPDQMAVELFGMGIINDLGGQDLTDFLSSVAKNIKWSSLTLAPGYIGLSSSGDVVLYFIHDPDSDVGNVYSALCEGYGNPMSGGTAKYMENFCARSMVTDSAYNGCWAADSSNNPYGYQEAPSDGAFCLFATIMLEPVFYSTEAQQAYLAYANDQLDDWKTNMLGQGKQPSFTPQSDGNFCNGKQSCLAFFFGRSAPYAALDGQGNYYIYQNDFLSGSSVSGYADNSNGVPENIIADIPKVTKVVVEVIMNVLAIGFAAFFSVLVLRKYRRRRRKGLSNYDIFFGSARKRWKKVDPLTRKKQKRRDKKKKKETKARIKEKEIPSKNEALLISASSGWLKEEFPQKSPVRYNLMDEGGKPVPAPIGATKAPKFGFGSNSARGVKKPVKKIRRSGTAEDHQKAEKIGFVSSKSKEKKTKSIRRSGTAEEHQKAEKISFVSSPSRSSDGGEKSKGPSEDAEAPKEPQKTFLI